MDRRMKNSENRKVFYLTLSTIGLIATWYFNIRHINEHGGFSVSQFVAEARANPAAISIFNDLSVVALTFFVWSYSESKRLKMRYWPVYTVLTFVVALAFTFPLFLFMRERKLASSV